MPTRNARIVNAQWPDAKTLALFGRFTAKLVAMTGGWPGMKMARHARNFSPSGEMSFKSQCRRSYANAGPYIDSDDGRHRFLFSIEMKLHHKHRRDYVKAAFIPRDVWPLLDLNA